MRRHALPPMLLMPFLLLAGCRHEIPVEIPGVTGPRLTDEEQIRAVLNDVQRGMEAQRIYKVLAHVSRGYRDAEGRDYEAMQEYLNTLFKRYRELKIVRVRPEVFVDGRRARAVETFGTVATPLNPDDRQLQLQGQVDVYLEKTGDTWQITEWGSVR
ncbi:MAG: hypothetical protein JXR94_02900 [Candidatus Hydrogenedentes bacterium]|nr:hypothetical protein [Candidatus Hydrogenedentota bacterium]